MSKNISDAVQSRDSIPVFFSADNNYAVQTYIAIFSMMYNYKGSLGVNAYILCPGGYSEKNMALINSLNDRFNKLSITVLNMDDKYENVEIPQTYISSAAMYRLEIPNIVDNVLNIQIDKCIYLDCDLVVEGDISELYNEDISGYFIGGVADPLQFYKKYNKHAQRIGIPNLKQYINSGVMLINLKEINATPDVREKLEKAGFNDDMIFKDQDAINYAFNGGIKLLPMKYNAFTVVTTRKDKGFIKIYSKKNMKEARENPFIVHYIGKLKPWLYKTEYMSDRWWRYVKMQDRNIRREYIKPFVKENRRMSFMDTQLLAIRGRLKSTGRYYDLIREKNKYILKIDERLKKYDP
ncbi:MAG: glycosyltransferase family 8 protein [Ruminococcaceae bacterium]|nr:glycosyltransferase family 8 protein [Oscillospiraceae bacterium]